MAPIGSGGPAAGPCAAAGTCGDAPKSAPPTRALRQSSARRSRCGAEPRPRGPCPNPLRYPAAAGCPHHLPIAARPRRTRNSLARGVRARAAAEPQPRTGGDCGRRECGFRGARPARRGRVSGKDPTLRRPSVGARAPQCQGAGDAGSQGPGIPGGAHGGPGLELRTPRPPPGSRHANQSFPNCSPHSRRRTLTCDALFSRRGASRLPGSAPTLRAGGPRAPSGLGCCLRWLHRRSSRRSC
ncbi:translation initiation factor IF-2-like [Bubalus bubalis]|uniref:translation initiation factor IF-2-like n=1 Tax=Bubalus bubalis TaxID=89462 RepID=UPI001E1B9E55|nr:translation initiation factor IF-2-like [Bubalus bubalis]